jgi:flagellar biosynthesis protein FliP
MIQQKIGSCQPKEQDQRQHIGYHYSSVSSCDEVALAQSTPLPPLQINLGTTTQSGDLAIPLQILLLLTLLGFIPALLIAMTSFTRIVIVLSLLRQALGVQQVPPNQVLIGLALLLTIFIMRPVGDACIRKCYSRPGTAPYHTGGPARGQSLARFWLRQTREKDLAVHQVAHASGRVPRLMSRSRLCSPPLSSASCVQPFRLVSYCTCPFWSLTW